MSNTNSNDTDPLQGFTPVDPLSLTLRELRDRVYALTAAGVHSHSTPLPPEHYRCCICLRTERKGWSDAEAADEFTRRFPQEELDTRYTVCDACNIIISVVMEA